MAPTGTVIDLSQSEETLEEIMMEDMSNLKKNIRELPEYAPSETEKKEEVKEERRVNYAWYAAVIMRTRDYSPLEKIEVDAAAQLMRRDDKACYNPAVNPMTAILLMPGGKFIPDTQPKLIKRFERQITDSVRNVVRNVRGSSRKLEFIYFNYHEDHSTTPEEFAKAMDKMLEYL